MKYIVVLAFALVYILGGEELGYTDTSSWWTHCSYMFQHANIWHLIVNCIAYIQLFSSLEKFIRKEFFLILSALTAFGASFFASYEIPTVGASGILYAMTGMYTGLTLFRKGIKIVDKKKYLLYIAIIIASLLISHLKTNSNFALHIICLMTTFLFVLIFYKTNLYKLVKKITGH